MASFGLLLHSITTATINRLLRENGYTTWAYYVDIDNAEAGVAFANDTTLALYRAADPDRLALSAFGMVLIKNVRYQPNKRELAMSLVRTTSWYGVQLFTDASMVTDDEEISPRLDTVLTGEWRQYLIDRGMQRYRAPRSKTLGIVLIAVVALIIIGFSLYILRLKPQ